LAKRNGLSKKNIEPRIGGPEIIIFGISVRQSVPEIGPKNFIDIHSTGQGLKRNRIAEFNLERNVGLL
jgi:hypothetical protein